MRTILQKALATLAVCLALATPVSAEDGGFYLIGEANSPVQVRVPHVVPVGGKIVWGAAMGGSRAAGQTGGFDIAYLGYDPAKGAVHLRSHWAWKGPKKAIASIVAGASIEGTQDLIVPLHPDGSPTTFTVCFAPVITVPDNYPIIDLTINGLDDHMRLVMGEPSDLLLSPPE